MSDAVVIHTDGACSGNPGPGGWGAVLQYNGHVRELKGGLAETTNNQMELTAAIEALNALKRSLQGRASYRQPICEERHSVPLFNWKKKLAHGDKAGQEHGTLAGLDAAVQRHAITWHWGKGPRGRRIQRTRRPAGQRGHGAVWAKPKTQTTL